MARENKRTYTYAAVPSIRDRAKKKAEKEGYSLSVKIEMLLREYLRPKIETPIEKWKEKADKWDALGEKISKFYPDVDENGDELPQEKEGDLVDIGEVAAMAFGFL